MNRAGWNDQLAADDGQPAEDGADCQVEDVFAHTNSLPDRGCVHSRPKTCGQYSKLRRLSTFLYKNGSIWLTISRCRRMVAHQAAHRHGSRANRSPLTQSIQHDKLPFLVQIHRLADPRRPALFHDADGFAQCQKQGAI